MTLSPSSTSEPPPTLGLPPSPALPGTSTRARSLQRYAVCAAPAMTRSPPSSTSEPSTTLGLPPRRAGHRRSQSDIPFDFTQLSPPLPTPVPVKREITTVAVGSVSDGGDNAALYDLFNTYMDLYGLPGWP